MTNISHLTPEQQQMLQMQALAQAQAHAQAHAHVHAQAQLQQMPLNMGQIPMVGPKDEVSLPQIPPESIQMSQMAANTAAMNLNSAQLGALPQQQQQQQQHHNHQAAFSSAGNNTFFNDLLSPFFAPYGIDVSHFPLTNPPIFDSAMMMNPQGQPRRRISISNGQIGQITNHDHDDFFSNSDQSHQSSEKGQDDINVFTPQMGREQLPMNAQVLPAQSMSHMPPQQQQQQQQQQQHVVPQPAATTPISTPRTIPTNSNGIPTQKLMYNNEIIFNPEAGPIPGTAAWKKARLLERNRVAASKCRQRKKAAQNQLKEDVQKYTREINSVKRENEHLKKLVQEAKKYAGDRGLSDLLEKLAKMEADHAESAGSVKEDALALDDDDDDDE